MLLHANEIRDLLENTEVDEAIANENEIDNMDKVLKEIAIANSENLDQTALKEQSDQGRHCLSTLYMEKFKM